MLNNIDNKLNRELNKMTTERKYQLLEQIEEKHFGNESTGENILEPIVTMAVDLFLDATTLLAKCLGIIK